MGGVLKEVENNLDFSLPFNRHQESGEGLQILSLSCLHYPMMFSEKQTLYFSRTYCTHYKTMDNYKSFHEVH